jgi:hypothetical protein
MKLRGRGAKTGDNTSGNTALPARPVRATHL